MLRIRELKLIKYGYFPRPTLFKSPSIRYHASRVMSGEYNEDARPPPIERNELAQDVTALKLPGFGLPISKMPKPFNEDRRIELNKKICHRYVTHDDGDVPSDEIYLQRVTTREAAMLRFMNTFTEKTDWEREIFDENAVQRRLDEVFATDSPKIITQRCIDYVSQL